MNKLKRQWTRRIGWEKTKKKWKTRNEETIKVTVKNYKVQTKIHVVELKILYLVQGNGEYWLETHKILNKIRMTTHKTKEYR